MVKLILYRYTNIKCLHQQLHTQYYMLLNVKCVWVTHRLNTDWLAEAGSLNTEIWFDNFFCVDKINLVITFLWSFLKWRFHFKVLWSQKINTKQNVKHLQQTTDRLIWKYWSIHWKFPYNESAFLKEKFRWPNIFKSSQLGWHEWNYSSYLRLNS